MTDNPLERWPGYDEQSWQERFAELDRRYIDQQRAFIETVKQLSRPAADIEYLKREAVSMTAVNLTMFPRP